MSNPNKFKAPSYSEEELEAARSWANAEATKAAKKAKREEMKAAKAAAAEKARYDAYWNATPQDRRVLAMVDQLTKARKDYPDASENPKAYQQLVVDRESALRNMLNAYDDKLTPDFKAFVIEKVFDGNHVVAESDQSKSETANTHTTDSSVGTESLNKGITEAGEEVGEVEVSAVHPEASELPTDDMNERVPMERMPVLVEEESSADTASDDDFEVVPIVEAKETKANNGEFEEIPASRALVPVVETESDDEGDPTEAEVEHGPRVEELAPELDITDLIKESHPEIYKEYDEAWNEYVEAHAQDRYSDFGTLINKFAKKGGWVEKVRNRVGKKFETRGHKRRAAMERFQNASRAAREAALEEYNKEVPMTPEERRMNRMLLDADNAYTLEYQISERRIAIDSGKSPVSRKIARWATGLGAATVGALTAFADGAGKGQHHLAWLTGATIAGALIGYRAEMSAQYGSENAEERIEARANHAYDTVLERYEDDRQNSMENEAMAVDTTEYMTNAVQDENMNRARRATKTGTRLAMGGAAVAWGTHIGVDYISSQDFHIPSVHLNTYDGKGHDFNPFDGNGLDFHDGDKFDPLQGDFLPAGDYHEPAPVVTVPEDITHPEVVDTPDTQAGNGGDGNGGEQPVDLTGDGNTANDVPATSAETAGTNEASDAGTEVYIPDSGSMTGMEQDYVYQTHGINLTDQQSYDMYQDIMRDHAPGDVLANADFYTLPNGDVGIVDPGPATVTPVGEEAINDWLVKHDLINHGV